MAPQDYPHKFFGSRTYAFFSILMGIGFFSILVYGIINSHGNEASIIGFFVLSALFFIMGWRQMTNKTPHLQFGPAGIWTPKSGHLPWQKITLRLGTVYAGKAGSVATIYILERQTRRHVEGISITGLDYSSSHVEEALRSYKKANIISS